MDQLAAEHVVGEEEGTKARKVLMSMEEFDPNDFVNLPCLLPDKVWP